jgi:hypothetical protein
MLSKTFLIALGAAFAAGCATQSATTTTSAATSTPSAATPSAGAAGKHLVYRDTSGAIIRQFDYPSEDFCRRVEQMAGGAARCEASSVGAQMAAHATLRYNPPGTEVQAHYADLTRCRSETGQLGPGVQLVTACAPK